MKRASYGMYNFVVLYQKSHSSDFWYVNNSCVNTVHQHFPWSFTTRQWDFKIQCSVASTLFFPDFLRAQSWFEIIWKWSERKQKLLGVSGRFELSRVRVTEGKITVNVWRKSGENRFWFELARDSSYRESAVCIIHRMYVENAGLGRLVLRVSKLQTFWKTLKIKVGTLSLSLLALDFA